MSLLSSSKKDSIHFEDRTTSMSSENIPEVNKTKSDKHMEEKGFCFSFLVLFLFK